MASRPRLPRLGMSRGCLDAVKMSLPPSSHFPIPFYHFHASPLQSPPERSRNNWKSPRNIDVVSSDVEEARSGMLGTSNEEGVQLRSFTSQPGQYVFST